MTQKEIDIEIGRAFRERRDILRTINCIKHRLRKMGDAASTLAVNPDHAESESVMDSASDVREDFAELKRSISRLNELEKVLS